MNNGKSTSWLTMLLSALWVLALAACRQTPSYPDVLRQADSLANVEPEEAISLLQGLEEEMADAPLPTQMYYRLLRIKADDKAYVTHTSDSLILSVLHYYESGGDPALLSKAYYYAGRVYRDLDDAPQALAYFQKGLEVADEGDETVGPVLYAQMGEIFFGQSLYAEALEMYQEAYQLDSLASDTLGILLDLRDIAFTYRMQERYDTALELLLKAENMAQAYGDAEMTGLIASQLAGLYNRQGDYERASGHITLALANVGSADLESAYDVYADILVNTGRWAEAEGYFEQLTHSDNLHIRMDAYDGLATLAANRNRIDDYLHYFRQYKAVSDSIQRVAATASVSRMNALYNYQLRERENAELKAKNQQDRILIISLLSVFALAAVATWTYYRHRRIQMHHRLEKLQRLQAEQYRQSEAFIEANRKEMAQLQRRLGEANLQNLELVHRLEAQKDVLERSNRVAEIKIEQREQTKNAIQRSEVMARLQEMVAQGRHVAPQDIADIESLLNDVCPDFLPYLHQLGELNELEYQVSLLLKLGLSPAVISTLVLREKTTVSAIRRRLYKKITGQSGTPSDWDEIIISL